MNANMPTASSIIDEIKQIVLSPHSFRSVFILISSLLVAYWLSQFLAKGLIFIAQRIASRSDKESDEARAMRLRQTETYLSMFIAIVRALVVIVVGYIAWILLSPTAGNNSSGASGLAAIGAGAMFALIAGQTIGIILRDLTAGAIMISENWYKIGDYVKLEPYSDLSGVVERFTLRSTRVRSLNGELITVHNQNITGVRVAPRGVRTIAVDIFVRDKDRGVNAIQRVIAAIPKGPTMLARPLHITNINQWGNNRWHITVVGQTAPGREWLIEKFFVNAVSAFDEDKEPSERLLSLPPISHNADETANKRLKRAVRVKRDRPQQSSSDGKTSESAHRMKRTPVHAYINQRLRTFSKGSMRAQQPAREPRSPARKN